MFTVNYRGIMLSLLSVSTIVLSNAYGKKRSVEYGFFDLSIGPSFLEDVEFNNVKSEYQIGPCISTSVGLTHDSGLGIGLNYIYSYNTKLNKLAPSGDEIDINVTESQDAASSSIKLGFMYKFSANTEIALVVNAGPCMTITNDHNLRVLPKEDEETDAAAGNASVEIKLSDAATGNATTELNVSTGNEAVENKETDTVEAESVPNFSFGYNISAGLEYRSDRHNAYGFEIGYTNSHLFKSKFADNTDTVINSAQSKAPLENTYANILVRYYM